MDVVNFKIEDEICLIEVNNPPVNAISVEVRKGLLDAVIDLEQNEEIKAVVICAPNRTFLAGADIREFGKNIDGPVKEAFIYDHEDEKLRVVDRRYKLN